MSAHTGTTPLFSRLFPDAEWLVGIRAALKSCGGGNLVWHRRHCTVYVYQSARIRELFRSVGVEGF